MEIPLTEIFSDEDFNCRGKIVPFDVIDLSKDIEANGLIQPIAVQPYNKNGYKYRIIVGHRRYAACKLLKKETIKAEVVTGLDEKKARTLNVVENLSRENLNILQEAKSLNYYRLYHAMSASAIAKEVGKSYGWVEIRLALLDLPKEIQQEAAAGFLTQEDIKKIAQYGTKEMQFRCVREIKDRKLRGTKPNFKKRQNHTLIKREMQTRTDIEMMIDRIFEIYGRANLTTRALAWAAGNISDMEFCKDLKAEADKLGKPWSIPQEFIA